MGTSSEPLPSARSDRKLARRSSFRNHQPFVRSDDLGESSLIPISDSDMEVTPEAKGPPISRSPGSEGDCHATGRKRHRSSRVVSPTS